VPMTRREQMGLGRCGLWEKLLLTRDRNWLDVLRSERSPPEDWRALARRGGFPTPAVHMKTQAGRAVWFEGYGRSYLGSDLQALSAISAVPDFRRLVPAASLRLRQLVNPT